MDLKQFCDYTSQKCETFPKYVIGVNLIIILFTECLLMGFLFIWESEYETYKSTLGTVWVVSFAIAGEIRENIFIYCKH